MTIAIDEVTFAEQRCVRLSNGRLEVHVLRDAGPRVIGFGFAGEDSMFSVQPTATLDCPGSTPFQFRGGHRLWVAPEAPAITYRPDDDPVTFDAIADGIRVTGPPDTVAGFRKSIEITLGPAADTAIFDHRIENIGPDAKEFAAWTITLVPLGGEAWLPQPRDPVDPGSRLPNRSLVLWPYTRLDDPRLTISDGWIVIRAADGEPLKVGWHNNRGWLAYRIGRRVFAKSAAIEAGGRYTDLAASAQCYIDERALELETLGPMTTVPPDGAVTHRETWRLFEVGDDADPEYLAHILG